MADPISRIRTLNRSRKARKGIPPYYEVKDPATNEMYRVYGAKSQQEADQRVWNDVAMQRSKGGEQEIELPSELPAERQEFLDKAENPPKAEVLAFKPTRAAVKEPPKAPTVGAAATAGVQVDTKPKKLEPGLYLDEETDKYFRVTESGDMVEVNLDAETP
jgi:hypothetical protein